MMGVTHAFTVLCLPVSDSSYCAVVACFRQLLPCSGCFSGSLHCAVVACFRQLLVLLCSGCLFQAALSLTVQWLLVSGSLHCAVVACFRQLLVLLYSDCLFQAALSLTVQWLLVSGSSYCAMIACFRQLLVLLCSGCFSGSAGLVVSSWQKHRPPWPETWELPAHRSHPGRPFCNMHHTCASKTIDLPCFFHSVLLSSSVSSLCLLPVLSCVN